MRGARPKEGFWSAASLSSASSHDGASPLWYDLPATALICPTFCADEALGSKEATSLPQGDIGLVVWLELAARPPDWLRDYGVDYGWSALCLNPPLLSVSEPLPMVLSIVCALYHPPTRRVKFGNPGL